MEILWNPDRITYMESKQKELWAVWGLLKGHLKCGILLRGMESRRVGFWG